MLCNFYNILIIFYNHSRRKKAFMRNSRYFNPELIIPWSVIQKYDGTDINEYVQLSSCRFLSLFKNQSELKSNITKFLCLWIVLYSDEKLCLLIN